MKRAGDKHQKDDEPRRSRNGAGLDNQKSSDQTNKAKKRATDAEEEFKKLFGSSPQSFFQTMRNPHGPFAPTQQGAGTSVFPNLTQPVPQQFANQNVHTQQQPSSNQPPLCPQFQQQQQYPPISQQPSHTIPPYQHHYQSPQQHASTSGSTPSFLTTEALGVLKTQTSEVQNILIQSLAMAAQQNSAPVHQVQENIINDAQPFTNQNVYTQQQPSSNQPPLFPQFQQQYPSVSQLPSHNIPPYQNNYQSPQQYASISGSTQSFLTTEVLGVLKTMTLETQNIVIQSLAIAAQQNSSPIHQVQGNIINEAQPRRNDVASTTSSKSAGKTQVLRSNRASGSYRAPVHHQAKSLHGHVDGPHIHFN